MVDEIGILKYYDILYYNEGNPTISDEEYDKLKEEARIKYPDHPYFQTVGSPVPGSKVKLPYILGSLEKVKLETVELFFKKRNASSYMVSSKIDGISIYVEYTEGKVSFSSTRGNGYEGKDITDKAKIFCRPITNKEYICLRGEATLLHEDHLKIGYKNRRNGAAGILNKKENIEYAHLIHPIFYEIIDGPEEVMNLNEIAKFKFLAELGLDIPDFIALTEPIAESLGSILRLFKKNALEYGYDIDGLVLKPIEYERENVYHPSEMVAFKSNDVPIEVEVLGVDWQISRMRKLKPVVSICPVTIGGVTVSKATGFNAEFIQENGIGNGSKITIVRSGDVIPHIVDVVKRVNPEIPELCPYCKEELFWKGVDIVCENPECSAGNEKRIAYFLRKLGAENITETTIRNLGIETIEECYKIDEFDIAERDGFGINRGEQFVNEVSKTLRARPEKLIAAFGIDGIGETIGKLIIDHMKPKYDIDMIFEFLPVISIRELESIDGIGPIIAKKFTEEYPKFENLIWFLFEQGLQIEEDVVSSISGKIFTLTGKGNMSRQNIETMITSNGGMVKSMSKKTDYLVTNDVDSQSSKARKARSYGVPMISYDELMGMINE